MPIASGGDKDLCSRVVRTKPVQELEEKKRSSSKIDPIIKTPSEIFRTINKEKQILQGLPKRKGILRVQILSESLASAEFKQVYCYLRNK